MSLDTLKAALSDRYTIERELGQGGMATVYLAHDIKHNRKVAIKVLREDLAASMGAPRFLREIQIAAQLQHPNILPLLDSGDAQGFLFYVMPFVAGQSLRERIDREGELPVHEAVRLLTEIVDALAHAHEHGVVHRDVKPDNVMLSGRHALVTDFGVAKAVSEATGGNMVTTLGVALGTPTYMSPEQAAADPNIDHRSDIYAVGVMAYELLTGRPPFVGSTPQQVLAAHVTEMPDPVTKRRQTISPALEAIVMRCLAKRPADRYQTAGELLSQLEPLTTPSVGMTPTHTRPISGWRPPAGWRRWLVPVLAGVVVLAVAAVTWQTLRQPKAVVILNVPRRQVTVSGTAEGAVALSPDGQRVAYANRECGENARCSYALVVQDVVGSGTLRTVESLKAVYEVSWTTDGRNLLFLGLPEYGPISYYLVPALGGAAPRLIPGVAVASFGGGDSLLIANEVTPGRISILATTSLDPTRGDTLFVERPGATPFAWTASPNGRWFLIESDVADKGTRQVVIFDRHGTARDSMRSARSMFAGFRGPRELVLGTSDSGGNGLVTVSAYPFNNDGRFTGARLEVLSSVPLKRATVSAGGIAYLAGTYQSTVEAVSRRTTRDAGVVARRAATGTGQLSVLMGSDGESVILIRTSTPSPRDTVTHFAVQSFAGGPERSLGGGVTGVQDRSRTVDGSAMVLLHRDGPNIRISRLRLADGSLTDQGTFPDSGDITGLEVMADGGLAWQFSNAPTSLAIRAPSGARRTVRLPPTRVGEVEDSPWGFGLIGWGFTYPVGDSVVIFHVAPGASEARVVLRAVFDNVPGLHWMRDGTVEVAVNESGASASFYRLDPTGGTLRRESDFPIPFASSVSFSNDGLRMAVRTQVPTLDVWVAAW
ncbi:MAG: serine/threonine-protein kinase [Gemmatimonadota bacterium]